MLDLVQQLQTNGTPIDAVGFQCHFIVGEVPTSFQSVLEQFTALGIEVQFPPLKLLIPDEPATECLAGRDHGT